MLKINTKINLIATKLGNYILFFSNWKKFLSSKYLIIPKQVPTIVATNKYIEPWFIYEEVSALTLYISYPNVSYGTIFDIILWNQP